MKIHRAKGSSTINDFIRPNKILCEVIGMMPVRFEKISVLRRYSVYTRIVFAVLAVNTVFVPEIWEIAANWGDLTILTSVGCVSMTVGQLLFKIFYLLYRREKVMGMFELVEELWNISDEPEDKRAIEKYARQAKIFTIVFFLSAFSNNVSFTTVAVVNVLEMRRHSDNETDYIRGLPFDVRYGNEPLSWTNFKLAFGCQSIAAIVCCVGIVGLDACMMTLVLHVCSQFLLIQCWFRKIGAKVKESAIARGGVVKYSFDSKIRCDISKCIQHHQNMLLIVEDVDELLNPVILIQFVTSGLEICLSGFAVTNSGTSNGDLMKFSCYLLSMVMQLIVWCWPGEVLSRESQGVGKAVYFDTPWYELPTGLRRDMGLVIARSQKACSITAMKFQTMSLRTLGNIFNTAASYFALLRQMNEFDEVESKRFDQ